MRLRKKRGEQQVAKRFLLMDHNPVDIRPYLPSAHPGCKYVRKFLYFVESNGEELLLTCIDAYGHEDIWEVFDANHGPVDQDTLRGAGECRGGKVEWWHSAGFFLVTPPELHKRICELLFED
jgi:hypothetical protein